jgi:hypothetical protein
MQSLGRGFPRRTAYPIFHVDLCLSVRLRSNLMTLKQTTILALLFSSLSPFTAARADQNVEENAQPYRCAESVVTRKGYYFEDRPDSGVYVEFATNVGVETFKKEMARVVDRSATAGSLLDQQKVGDKVQVCLIGSPPADASCHPAKDPRGRVYRVFNYRQKSAYSGTNANHLCGGA